MKDKKNKSSKNVEKGTTKYGEFVSSYFGWISPNKQKERAEELENITKNKNGK